MNGNLIYDLEDMVNQVKLEIGTTTVSLDYLSSKLTELLIKIREEQK